MKTFMAVYTGADSSRQHQEWIKLDEQTRHARVDAGMKAWHEWGAKHAASIVEQGGPLGRTKKMTSDGIIDIRNNLAGYIVVRAESHEAVAQLFANHPHFSIFPGDGVEIMEILPIPGS
jgi:hypothetical protein